MKRFDPESSARFLWEKRFWRTATAVVVVASVAWPDGWAKFGVAYVAFVSNYALDLTAHGAQKAAQAKEAAEEL